MKILRYILILFLFHACIEEVPIQTDLQSSFPVEDILVVEATITDELKPQEIYLSRGSNFANDSIVNFERNAQVSVMDELGNAFTFNEESPGKYVSSISFAASKNVGYELLVTTSNGLEYQSEMSGISGSSNIDDIYAERIVSDSGVEGMAIYVDSSNPNGDLNDYRYTYDETYKIIAPNWTAVEFEILQETLEFTEDGMPIYPNVALVEREQEEQVCYNTVASNAIILSNGAALNTSQIGRNLVRFINRDNPILSHRYSILVKQLLQTPEAAKFYRTLLQFSQSENLFSEIQPGLIEGNISGKNTDDLVIGFFNVASVTEKRLFFNYSEFFPGEELPPYFDGLNCNTVFSPPLEDPTKDGPYSLLECGFPRPLIDYLKSEEIEFFEANTNPPPICQGPYLVTQRKCGDCTTLGSNIIPDFWIEE